MSRPRRQFLVSSLFCIIFLGCSRGETTLVPVTGKVSYRGAIVRSGSIVFAPDARKGTNGPLARGDIQTDGSYRLQTGEAVGAIPGWHRVTIVALDSYPSFADSSYAVPRSLLPEKYRDPELSGLSCQVEAGKENKIVLNLD